MTEQVRCATCPVWRNCPEYRRGFSCAFNVGQKEREPVPNEIILLTFRGKEYSVSDCDGEAHFEPNIDNCMMCAPSWGVVVREKLTGKAPPSKIYSNVVKAYRARNTHRGPAKKEESK